MPIVHDSIRTNSDLDVYATHEAKLGKGGYRTVSNIAERDAIPFERCEEGMLVTVLNDNTNNNQRTTYILKTNERSSRTWEKYNNEKVYDKFIVIAVAGQSNAVGYDESPIKEMYSGSKDEARIKQLGLYGEDNLKIVTLGWCAQNLQDMRTGNRAGTPTAGTKGIHLPLANELLPYIPEDFGILILPIAFGGTGFNSGNNGNYDAQLMKPTNTGSNSGEGTIALKWGVGTAYYQTLRDRIKYALSLNENNRFGGIVWCQGENDKGNVGDHKTKFEEMTNQLFTELNDAGYGSRTPKGTFDKDIWYNMETVGYWYTFNTCISLWENYRTWNPKTYIEISGGAESNIINGTGATSQTKPSHFGNDAFSKVVAPAVAKALIRGNEFSKVSSEREITKDEVGILRSQNYPFGTDFEKSRIVTRDDFSVNHSSLTFSVDSEGTVTSNATLNGKLDAATIQPFVDFGDIYELEFEASRALYFVVYEAETQGERAVTSVIIGGARTGEINRIWTSAVKNFRERNLADGLSYTFVSGDRVRIVKNRDESITFYRTDNANGKFQYWFNLPRINLSPSKATLGFVFGASAQEAEGVGAGDVTLFKKLKIQKEEALVSNKFLKVELEEVYYSKIKPLETTISTLQQTIADLTNRVSALESPTP